MNKAVEAGKPPVKKGRPSWKPASVLDVIGKEDGYRYRWSNKAKDNLHKKEAEGWETLNGLQADGAKHVSSGRINDGAKLTSIYEKHDCVLQRIPEEVAQARDEYYQQQNARQIAGLTSHIKKDLAKDGAVAHGDITISSRRGTQVIE
jgi:hypothetical protein